jgi:uncharacterized protein (TIGR02246 family)
VCLRAHDRGPPSRQFTPHSCVSSSRKDGCPSVRLRHEHHRLGVRHVQLSAGLTVEPTLLTLTRGASSGTSWLRSAQTHDDSERDTDRTMSEESTIPDLVELMGRAFEAANRRDLDAVASSFAEDATFDGRALGDHFEGRAAIRSFLEDWFGTYEELEFGLAEVRDLGNGVVFAVVVQNGRPAGSAGRLRQREGWVVVWVRGLIARLTISEVDEARAAAERLAEERE